MCPFSLLNGFHRLNTLKMSTEDPLPGILRFSQTVILQPLTGEVLPENDSCNQVEIVRALNTVLRYLDNQPQKATKPSPDNAGKPWTVEDEETLSRMFDQGCTKKEICSYFKRSPGAIAARLVKLGKISERINSEKANAIRRQLYNAHSICPKEPYQNYDNSKREGNIPEVAPNCVASGMLLCRMTS